MAFDANREIKIEASQNPDGTFVLRTKGLAAQKRPELEVAGVPEAALHAAGRILNDVADYSVNRAEVQGDQNVGFELAVDDAEADTLMLAVRTKVVEAPKEGFFAKLTGGSKGVIRLVDVDDERNAPPLTALATMLVHRAATRRVGGDEDGAREELEAALRIFPGDVGAGEPPGIESSAVYNWQNHLAYLALAELDVDRGAELYAEALARSVDLQRRELGAPLEAFAAKAASALEAEAREVVSHVMNEGVDGGDSGIPDMRMLKSPVLEVTEHGCGRRAAIVPAAFVEYYYEGRAKEVLTTAGPTLAAGAVADAAAKGRIPALAWSLRTTRDLWISRAAPFVAETDGEAAVLLSMVLADIGRAAKSDATEAEIASRLAGTPMPSLLEKMAALDAWEAEQMLAAMGVPSSKIG